MIPASVQKPGKPLSPCPLLPAPCGLNDKSLTGHDIIYCGVGVSPAFVYWALILPTPQYWIIYFLEFPYSLTLLQSKI
ncbi:hypothetical protein NSTCB13_02054 [Nostoc sp. DSM 114160]|jgi:hypothetical protein